MGKECGRGQEVSLGRDKGITRWWEGAGDGLEGDALVV